ncbi:hypothetical protein, partial [Aeromonas caviae]|uniref:hypothetical protein n=1 Tax=Aeromonas caviae TaxID=648 RepID=UPI0025B65B6F
EGGNINMMHGDSRVMVVVCLATTSLPAPCLSTSTFPGSREEPKKTDHAKSFVEFGAGFSKSAGPRSG